MEMSGGNRVDWTTPSSSGWQHLHCCERTSLKVLFKGTYIEDIAKTVTLRLKAPHTLMLWPSVFKVANVCGTNISSISWFCVSNYCRKSELLCLLFALSKATRGLLPLTSAWSASHTARFKAAMFGLIPSIHDGGWWISEKGGWCTRHCQQTAFAFNPAGDALAVYAVGGCVRCLRDF
jgi:hypothetical protein